MNRLPSTAAQIARDGPAWLVLWPDLLVALGVAGILLYWTVRDALYFHVRP